MRAILTAVLLTVVCGTAAGGETCRAVDGDTLRCGTERVRIRNINAAELAEPGGIQAHERLQALVMGRNVSLERMARDRYGRTVAIVYIDGRKLTQRDIGPRAGRGAPRYRR